MNIETILSQCAEMREKAAKATPGKWHIIHSEEKLRVFI